MNSLTIYINTEYLILGVLSIGTLLTFAAWLSKKWIGARIDQSVQHHYDKELEDYRTLRTRRGKAELIAKLFSVWIKYRGKETEFLTKQELIERYEELNRMSLELSLWVEDVELLNDIMTRLQNSEDAKSIRTLVGEVRKLILEKTDDFNPLNIVLWPAEKEVENTFGSK